MSASVSIDLKNLKKLGEDLEKACRTVCTVGIKDMKGANGVSTQEYSVYLEYGWVQRVTPKQAGYLRGVSGVNVPIGATLSNPPRPFFRGTKEAEGEKWLKVLKNAVAYYQTEDIFTAHQKALNMVGLLATQDIQQTLINGGTSKMKFAKRSPLTQAILAGRANGHQSDGSGTTASAQAGNLSGMLVKSVGFEIEQVIYENFST